MEYTSIDLTLIVKNILNGKYYTQPEVMKDMKELSNSLADSVIDGHALICDFKNILNSITLDTFIKLPQLAWMSKTAAASRLAPDERTTKNIESEHHKGLSIYARMLMLRYSMAIALFPETVREEVLKDMAAISQSKNAQGLNYPTLFEEGGTNKLVAAYNNRLPERLVPEYAREFGLTPIPTYTTYGLPEMKSIGANPDKSLGF